MADPQKISGLTKETTFADSDIFPFSDVSAGFDKGITGENLLLTMNAPSIENVAELKTTEGKRDGQVVNLLGHDEAGDGGGGLIRWDATSTRSDNDGTVWQVTGVTTGRWIRLAEKSEYVNIKWFGCKTDGTDITSAYESARSYAEGTRRRLSAPAGEYSFDGLIRVTAGASLIGDSTSSVSGEGTRFKKMSSSATFRIDHSTICRDFTVDANGEANAIDTEQTTSGTAGVKYATLDNVWAVNFTERGFNFNDYAFNLTMIAPKTRANSSATNPISLYLRHETSGTENSLTSPAISIINPSFYGTTEEAPKGTAISARGANAMHISGGEFVKHGKWFSFRDCQVVFHGVDFEYNTSASIIDDSQVKINGGIVHTFRGDSADYTLEDIPFTDFRRMFFVVRQSDKQSNFTVDGVEFRNYLGTDTGTADGTFAIVGVEQNVLDNEFSTVTIKNEMYSLGDFGQKILVQQENTGVPPILQLGRNKYIKGFQYDFSGSETGENTMNHFGGTFCKILNKSIVRSVYWQVEGTSLTNDTDIKLLVYDETGAVTSTTTLGTISASDDEGNTKSNEIEVNSLGRISIVLDSTAFPDCNVNVFAQVEER